MNPARDIDPGKLSLALRAWLDAVNRANDELRRQGVRRTAADARDALAEITRRFVTRRVQVAAVHDDTVAGEAGPIPVRLYDPSPAVSMSTIHWHGAWPIRRGIWCWRSITGSPRSIPIRPACTMCCA